MIRIIMKAIFIVLFGTLLLLVAGVLGKNQMISTANKGFLGAGVVGTSLILFSLSYSLRKHFRMWGNLKLWLRFHEVSALAGTAIIIWHTGLRVHNVIGWAALFLMLILCVSGLVGRYLHLEISRELARRKKESDDPAVLSQLQWWRDHFKYWRKVHIPMTKMAFFILFIHLLGTAFYGGWQP